MVSRAVAGLVRPCAVMVVVVMVVVVPVGQWLVTLLLLGVPLPNILVLVLLLVLLLFLLLFLLVEELSAWLDISRVLALSALSALGGLRVQSLLPGEAPGSTGVVVMVVMVVVVLSPGGRRAVVDVLGSPGRLRPQRPLLLIALPFGLCVGIRLVLALLVMVVVVVMVVLVILSGALPLH